MFFENSTKWKKLDKNIMAIIAPKETGKSTLASCIANLYGYTSIKSFAGPIKDMLSPMYKDVYGKDKEQLDIFGMGIPLRKAMTTLGRWGRNTIHEDIWINYLDNYLSSDSHFNYIIDDLRFKNELSYLVQQEATIILLTRMDSYKRLNNIDESEQLSHDLIDIANNRISYAMYSKTAKCNDSSIIEFVLNYPKFIQLDAMTLDTKVNYYQQVDQLSQAGFLPKTRSLNG
jgi:hypothetical protein